MSEYVVYILYSQSHNKFYRGFTSNLIERFKSHNELSNKGFAKKFRPWKVVYVEFYCSKTEAIKRGKFV